MSRFDADDLAQQSTQLDEADVLAPLRKRFVVPRTANGEELAYFAGNSLGLMPTAARDAVGAVLDNWATYAVEGHFEPEDCWYEYDHSIAAAMAPLVGATADEVAAMGSLTENLHLLLASFYRPSGNRNLLVIEADAFPSDRYMAETQAQLHGLQPDDVLLELTPDQLSVEGFADVMASHGERIATVVLGGVNYLTGTVLPMQAMTAAAHDVGVTIGFDLAHAAGNVELALHDWGVDFAAWCSYKYLNAGPGATAGIFVHQKHGEQTDRFRLGGWWGNDPATRFAMDTERRFIPASGANGYKVSNPSILAMAPLRPSLGLFAEAGAARTTKSIELTAFLRTLNTQLDVEILTPEDACGAQLSVRINADAKTVQQALVDGFGVLCDMRPPNVVRFAPTPLYNSYDDCARAALALQRVVSEAS